jgi:predicted dehydrogenase
VNDALIIGQGSIGRRHARILQSMGQRVFLVSTRQDVGGAFATLSEALNAREYNYAVIANDTARHLPALEELSAHGFAGTVLVEKPLFGEMMRVPVNRFLRAGVGYNLRFHPVLTRLKTLLGGRKVLTANIYVGQYLPDWRPGTNHLESSSALKVRGGGVLRDLSHELDYALWLFGPWVRLTAGGGRLGSLTVDTDDFCTIIAVLESDAILNVTVSYLDRIVRREIIVNCEDVTIQADLITGTILTNGATETFPLERDGTYLEQHQAMLHGDLSKICTLDQGLKVVEMIGLVESALAEDAWLTA